MKKQVAFGLLLLLPISVQAQVTSKQKTDESILRTVQDAREQAKSWIDAWLYELSSKGMNGDKEATKLLGKISDDRERLQKWEVSAWSPSNSSLLAGEYVDTELGNGVVMISGNAQTAVARGLPAPTTSAKPDEKLLYAVTAPPAIQSRILMEGLRHDISNYSELVQYKGKDSSSDVFIVAWKSVWHDAQGIYCKHHRGAKYTDLNGEEQSCEN